MRQNHIFQDIYRLVDSIPGTLGLLGEGALLGFELGGDVVESLLLA